MIKLNIINPDHIIDNSWSVSKIAALRPPPEWSDVFKESKLELDDISEILENDKKVNGRFYPDCNNLFKAFEMTPLNSVKVVIIGQDPYCRSNDDGTPQAQGMGFGVKKGFKVPPPLLNIYKELKTSVIGFNPPSHGDLSAWSHQGVLLLNSCLTVRPSNAGCHKELWLGFIKKVINAIIDVNPNCIFVLWGRQAQKIHKMIGERVSVLETSHPGKLSCYRGFFGCNHFNEINDLLTETNQIPINWNL